MPALLENVPTVSRLPQRLSRLRVRFRTVLLLREGSQVVLLGLLLAGLAAYLDWRLTLSPVARAFALCGTLAAVGLLAVFRIVIPWQRERTVLAMARRVERQFPQCNDALVSAVQFLEDAGGYGSRHLRIETVHFAELIADEIDFRAAVSTRGLRRTLTLLAGSLICFAWLVTQYPLQSHLALRRLALPYAGLKWPPQTWVMVVRPGPLPYAAVRHEPLEIEVKIRGAIPDRAVLSIMDEGGRVQEQAYPMPRPEAGVTEASLVVRLEPERVDQPFQFRIRANDGDSGWHRVEVHVPPAFVPRDGRPSAQITLVYPHYMERPPAELLDGTGDFEAVTGTRVVLRAAVDRPLARAELSYRPDRRTWPALAAITALTAPGKLQAAAGSLLAAEFAPRIPVRLSGDRQLLDVEFIPLLPGQYVLTMEDDLGLTGERVFQIRIETDPVPVLTLLKPAASEALPLVADGALELLALAKDERFGLNDVWIEFRTSPHEPFRRLPLWKHSVGRHVVAALPFLLPVPPAGGPAPFRPLAFYPAVGEWKLTLFRHADGGALQEGDVLELRLAADDRDHVTWNKPAGLSGSAFIEVVSPNRIDAFLQQGLAKVRQDLQMLHEGQCEARSRLLEAMRDGRRIAQEPHPKLVQSEQSQEQVRLRWLAREEGTLVRLERLRRMVGDNRLPASATTQRLESLHREMRRLQAEELEPLLSLWERARGQSDLAALGKPASRIEGHQREIEESLKALLDRMQPWSAASDARGEARLLLGELRRRIAELDRLQTDRPSDAGGRPREELTAPQQDDLDRLGAAGDAVVAGLDRLLDKLGRSIDEKETAVKRANDSERQSLQRELKALRQAVESLGSAPNLKLGEAPGRIRRNQLADAKARMEGTADRLQKAVEALADEQDVPRLRKRPPELAGRFDKLIEAQERLQKRIAEAWNVADPKQRGDELRRLAAEQQAVEGEAEKLYRELNRQDEDLASPLSRAMRKMREQRGQLEGGALAEQAGDEALGHLEDVREQLDATKGQEALQREQQSQAADAVKSLRDRQAAAVAELKRLHEKALQLKRWSAAAARDSLPALIDQQDALSKEARNARAARFDKEPVFARLVELSAAAMEASVKRLGGHRENVLDQLDGIAPFDKQLEEEAVMAVRRWQELALARLDQLLEALKPAAASGPEQGSQGGMMGNEGNAPDLPPLAQLKALRLLQADVAERTRAFDEAHRDPSNLSEEDAAYLNALRQTQAEIVELLRGLGPKGGGS